MKWRCLLFLQSYQQVFNAFTNKWDLCNEFNFGNKDEHESKSDSEDDDSNYAKNFISQLTSASPLSAPVDAVEHEDSFAAPMHSRDPLNTLSLEYGYIPHSSADDVCTTFNWDAILRFLRFVHNLDKLDVPELEKSAMMNFFCTVVSKDGANEMGTDFENIFPFQQVQHPSNNLFVFSSPPSNVCHWVLGVYSPAAALYVCCYILENPQAHTILTVAHRLLDQGIRFCTLLPLPYSPQQLTLNKP